MCMNKRVHKSGDTSLRSFATALGVKLENMEKNRINYAKFQILKYVEHWYIEVSILVAPDIEECLNKPSHGLTKRELIIILNELFESLELVAQSEHRGCFTPTLKELETALDESRELQERAGNTFYGMTSGANELFNELKQIYE